jgi:hypothetical protein
MGAIYFMFKSKEVVDPKRLKTTVLENAFTSAPNYCSFF